MWPSSKQNFGELRTTWSNLGCKRFNKSFLFPDFLWNLLYFCGKSGQSKLLRIVLCSNCVADISKFPFRVLSSNFCHWIENSAKVNGFHAQKVSHHASKKSRCVFYIIFKKSFVGKFAWWKNMFLLDLQKISQQIKMKIKTWY